MIGNNTFRIKVEEISFTLAARSVVVPFPWDLSTCCRLRDVAYVNNALGITLNVGAVKTRLMSDEFLRVKRQWRAASTVVTAFGSTAFAF